MLTTDRCLALLVLLFPADSCVGNDVVRNFCHDGHGQPVAIPLVAGRWVPIPCANNNVPHVFQVRTDEVDLPVQGEPFLSLYTSNQHNRV